MVIFTRPISPPGTSLKSLVNGFVLTKQTEGKSPRTVEFYGENLKRFLWYSRQKEWPDDIRMLTEWNIREFLGYVANETNRWGLEGNGSEPAHRKVSHTTVHHYYVVLANFFGWVVHEGFLTDNPTTKIKVAKPKVKVINPYTGEEINRMLAVCDKDYESNAKFLGSRNRVIVLMLLDTGVRLLELTGIKIQDVNTSNGNIRVMGKGNKERIVRIGKVAQKSLWRYLMNRPDNGRDELLLTEEGKPLSPSAVQCTMKRLKQRAGVSGAGSVHRFRAPDRDRNIELFAEFCGISKEEFEAILPRPHGLTRFLTGKFYFPVQADVDHKRCITLELAILMSDFLVKEGGKFEDIYFALKHYMHEVKKYREEEDAAIEEGNTFLAFVRKIIAKDMENERRGRVKHDILSEEERNIVIKWALDVEKKKTEKFYWLRIVALMAEGLTMEQAREKMYQDLLKKGEIKSAKMLREFQDRVHSVKPDSQIPSKPPDQH
jgi:site-specific recombinase XerD